MRAVVNKLQGASSEPPGDMGVCSGIRLGADAPGWSPPLPSAQQPAAPVHQPEGNQPPAADVTGEPSRAVPTLTPLRPQPTAGRARAGVKFPRVSAHRARLREETRSRLHMRRAAYQIRLDRIHDFEFGFRNILTFKKWGCRSFTPLSGYFARGKQRKGDKYEVNN